MPKNILIILGHPAHERISYCEALAKAYQEAALQAGHNVVFLKVSDLAFDPILHEGYKGDQLPEPDILMVQEKMVWAEHWVIVYPLWQFMIPALLKGFFERTLTKGFAYNFNKGSGRPVKFLCGKTVRLIQTMGMPGLLYRWIFKERGARALEDMLNFIGIKPVRATYCGLAENPNGDKRRNRDLERVRRLGQVGF